MEHGDIKVEVEDDHIVVSMPGKSLRTAYSKSVDGPRLILSLLMSVDKLPMTPARFRRATPRLGIPCSS